IETEIRELVPVEIQHLTSLLDSHLMNLLRFEHKIQSDFRSKKIPLRLFQFILQQFQLMPPPLLPSSESVLKACRRCNTIGDGGKCPHPFHKLPGAVSQFQTSILHGEWRSELRNEIHGPGQPPKGELQTMDGCGSMFGCLLESFGPIQIFKGQDRKSVV